MKGFAQADWAEHKAKFQQKFMLRPEWAEAESEIFNNHEILMARAINMNQNFWLKLKTPFTILAPMANVTDWAFRQVVIETGRPDVFYTEFLACDGIVHDRNRFAGELYFEENERPIVVQFFGSNPENFYKCAQLAQELGFDGIDINMGCPDKSVEKQGGGAALMKNPELAVKVIKETIRGAGKLPVSVKTRLGFNKIDSDWFKCLLDTDIVVLTVHGRTRKEMSKVPAKWDEIGKIAEFAKGGGKLIIGNGDVKNMEDVRQKAKEFRLDGIMVGRGIFENPWFFSDKEVGDPKERIKLLVKHLDNFEKLWPEGKNFDVMKRFFKIYINGFPGAKELRIKTMDAKNKKDVLRILK
ncbi:MAG: tRNA-dihydrouridine synthase [bacterium]|nr:tRNA-dihydrouridine synthase [bacterium]